MSKNIPMPGANTLLDNFRTCFAYLAAACVWEHCPTHVHYNYSQITREGCDCPKFLAGRVFRKDLVLLHHITIPSPFQTALWQPNLSSFWLCSRGPKTHPKSRNTKKHRVYANFFFFFFEKFAWTLDPSLGRELGIQQKLFRKMCSDELLRFGWIF